MIFWDSSAIVPLIVAEPQSPACMELISKDSDITVWTYTTTEVLSAIYRKYREGRLKDPELTDVVEKLAKLRTGWAEVLPREPVRFKAHRLIAVHPLRAADALQLAAALIAFHDEPEGETLVTFDTNLARAAQREGFTVIS